jgi:penicillin-binding protein 2
VSVARFYPDQSTAHLVGYVSQVSANDIKRKKYIREMSVAGIPVGKTGLENMLDKNIIGKVGFQRYEVNAFGKRIRQTHQDKGQTGENYRSTIDLDVQKFTASALTNVSGAVCVMDIYNGDIIAMVSSPNYDPNAFVHGVKTEQWSYLLNHRDKPLMNKAVSGLYPPGSTIKTIVALSALENDIASTKMRVKCKGVTELYGEKFHCWKKKGHGLMNMRSAIQRSCDVYFYEIARRLGVDRIHATAVKFGLGTKALDNFMEEKPGIVPSTKWKKSFIGQNWYLGETLHSGIGQGYFLSTPLQLCLMTAQIANGGYKIKPRLIFDKKDKNNDLKEYVDFKNKYPELALPTNLLLSSFRRESLFRNQENISFIKDAMYAATNEPGGTSYRSRFDNKKYIFAGKTGSSQVKTFTPAQRELEVKQKDIIYKDRDHALFVAFAPVSSPQYAISVLVEHGGSGSSAAAPIAKKIIKKVLDRHSLREKYQNLEGKNI